MRGARMRSPRAALLAILLLVVSAGCAPFPWESPEDFFIRCMPDCGIEVTDVQIEFFGDGMSLGYMPADMNAANFDAVSQRCTDELLRVYSSNTTTTRPE